MTTYKWFVTVFFLALGLCTLLKATQAVLLLGGTVENKNFQLHSQMPNLLSYLTSSTQSFHICHCMVAYKTIFVCYHHIK